MVYKANAANISENGLLLSEVGFSPRKKELQVLISLPVFPLFKEFDFANLQSLAHQRFHPKTIRFRAGIVRKEESSSTLLGLNILDIKERDQQVIAQYIEMFSRNLTYLLTLLDNLNTNPENLEKVRTISGFLGYSKHLKISFLREIVESDFFSLQWSQGKPNENIIH